MNNKNTTLLLVLADKSIIDYGSINTKLKIFKYE